MQSKLVALLVVAALSAVSAFAQKTDSATKTKQLPTHHVVTLKHGKADSDKTHSMPQRDPKTGRFMAKSKTGGHTMKGTHDLKPGPARDPKTGRFISKSKKPEIKLHSSSASTHKATPARDPKTGRFISKTKKP